MCWLSSASGFHGELLRYRGELERHRVDIHTAATVDRPAGPRLIRPDAHTAWAAAIEEPIRTAAPALPEALAERFGMLPERS